MAEARYVADFTKGNVLRQLSVFAAPLLLSNLLQIVYNMVDMVVVGQAMGKVGLSAVAIGGDVSNCLTFLAMGFASAGQVIIAQYLGAGRQDLLGRFIGTLATFLALCAFVLMSVCLAGRTVLLSWMHTPPESFGEALSYSTFCISGLIFIYGYNAVSAVLRGLGDSKHPFVFISFAALLNVALDLFFVLGLKMGAGGAALATVISQGLSFVLCVTFMYRKRRDFGLSMSVHDFRLAPELLLRLVKLGLPMAIKSASIQFSKLFVNSWINSYGVAVSAFAGIANKIVSISNLMSNALNTAGSSMIGQNIGARTYPRVKKILVCVLSISTTAAALMAGALWAFPEPVFRLFTSDSDVLAIGLRYVPIGVLVFFGSASRTPANALINGSGNTKVNFVTAILDGIVLRIGLGLLFGLTFGMKHYGFWLGDALAGFTPLWIGVLFYLSGKWKRAGAID